VDGGKFFQDRFTVAGERQVHLTAVLARGLPGDKAFGNEAVGEADGAVVDNLQAVGQFADGDAVAAGKPLDGKEGLMLLRGDAGGDGGGLAKMEELAQRMAEGGQGLVFGLGYFELLHRRRLPDFARDGQPRFCLRQTANIKTSQRIPLKYIVLRYNVAPFSGEPAGAG